MNLNQKEIINIKSKIGKINKAIIYLKDNLKNTLQDLIFIMKNNGEIDDVLNQVLFEGKILSDIDLLKSKAKDIKDYGAKGDGVNDDTRAFKLMVEKGIKKIIIPAGNYLITEPIELNEGTEIEGTSYRNCTLTFTENGCLTFTGKTILNGGKHKKYLTLRNLELQNIDKSERINPFLKLIACDYVKIYDCWIYGLGKQILLHECFDSRITNTDFEWGGSVKNPSVFAIELKSGDGYEYTNNIYFTGCRFESHVGTCIGTTGENTNKITFQNCKFESYNCFSNRHINIKKATSIYFKSCFFAGDLGNTEHCVYIDQVNDFEVNGFMEHSSLEDHSYNGKTFLYASGSGKQVVNITLNNKNKYPINETTFGITTYENSLYEKGLVKVNNLDNKSNVISTDKTSVATLSQGSTELNYTCPKHGFIYVTMTGEYGKTDPQGINIVDETMNYHLRLVTVGSNYVTGFMPVRKGDVITCKSNTSAEAYVSFIAK